MTLALDLGVIFGKFEDVVLKGYFTAAFIRHDFTKSLDVNGWDRITLRREILCGN